VELRQLAYVVQIAEERSFSRAAEKLHITQPSLSQQLSKLEKELGVLLFKRNTSSVELTHAGAVFVEKATRILDQVEQLRREMEDIAELRRGRLVIGSLPITGAHLLPRVIPAFRAAYPEIELVLVEETTRQLEKLTAEGGTDVSLLTLPLTEPTLVGEPVYEEDILLAVPAGHPLAAAGKPVPLAALKGEPFVTLKKGQGFRAMVHELCQSAGFSPNVVFESANIETVQSLIAAGMGIGFVPRMVIRQAPDPAEPVPVYLPLAERPTRTLVIAYRKGRYLSKAAEAFIRTFHSVFPPPDPSREHAGDHGTSSSVR